MLLIKSSKETLYAPLQSVCGIVERKHTLPILSNVLLDRQGDTLSFLATDIEIEIQTSTSVAENEGSNMSLTVGARKLQDILRSLPEEATVSLEASEKRAQLKAGKSRFSLQTLPVEDFPRITSNQKKRGELSMTQRDLHDLLTNTQYAMAMQDVRYYLNGLLLVMEENQLIAVATDSHRLACHHKAVAYDKERLEFILPRKTVLELSRLLMDNDDQVKITLYESQAGFEFGKISLLSKLIDGKFPDYGRVIPESLSVHISLQRLVLLDALNRVAILTNEKYRGVRILISDNLMKINALNADQEEAEEELEIEYSGDPIDIGFNINYLLDVLNHLSDEVVTWSFNDSNSSTLFSVPGNTTFKYIVMPMRI